MQTHSPITRSILALLLTLCLLLSGFPGIAAGTVSPEEYNEAAAQKAASLEKAYGIDISYPMGKTYAGIGTATLSTLEACLAYLTAPVVRELSAWSKDETGDRLSINYVYSLTHGEPIDITPVASYTRDLAVIEILIPRANSKKAISGSSPLAIVHELGHVAQGYFEDAYGKSKLSTQWKKLCGAAYGSSKWERTVFASEYASSDYQEDFAETFSFGFVCNRAGVSIAQYLQDADGNTTPLGKKVNFIGQLLSAYIEESEDALTNLAKCRTAPRTYTWNGLRMSGSSLEYRGFPAPHNVLNGTLKQLGIASDSSTWEKDVGGWVVTDTTGQRYLVFPGGAYALLKA
jgi:hypothetical protein